MSAVICEPHLVVQFCDADELEGDEEWTDYRRYHIASPEEHANNMYIGDQINYMLERVVDNPDLWWRITYEEDKQISTTTGVMRLGKTAYPVTDNNKHEVHVEEFRDRNGDGYYELNVGIPIYEQYPRFYTEHDQAAAPAEDDPDKINAGDYVKVSADPKTVGGGYVDPDFANQVCRVLKVNADGANVQVQHPEREKLTNVIDPKHLTKVNKDGSAIEKKGDAEHKAGEEVEGEDEPDDTIHVSDGDVITVYDEYGHEKQMRVSVI